MQKKVNNGYENKWASDQHKTNEVGAIVSLIKQMRKLSYSEIK